MPNMLNREPIMRDGFLVGHRQYYDDGSSQVVPLKLETSSAIKPSHYKRDGLECIQVITTMTSHLKGDEGFLIGNVIKYLWRWKDKNGLEDLKKAYEYLGKIITKLEG